MSSGGIIAIIVISALLGILFWAGIIYLIIKVLGKGKELADSSIAKNRAYAESIKKDNQDEQIDSLEKQLKIEKLQKELDELKNTPN